MKVLHLTAHLGGGVGRALDGLVAHARRSASDVEHVVVCLERPEKTESLERIRQNGCRVEVQPAVAGLAEWVREADIVQIEWWNHPATVGYLCGLHSCEARVVVWSHVSGLHGPILPAGLIRTALATLFTSPCSLEAPEVSGLPPELARRLGVVPSCGGFDQLPPRSAATKRDRLSVGYVGSLNFAKLHPRFVEYVATVAQPDFTVRMVGDPVTADALAADCARLGRPDLLQFRGFVSDVATELNTLNTFAYLLNPEHYGTTENALLEAMAVGIVPVVLDNPAERHIVSDGRTGLVVRSPAEFGRALDWLAAHPDERRRIGERAAECVRHRFGPERMAEALDARYRCAMASPKATVRFQQIFGREPADWFLACQRDRAIFADDGGVSAVREPWSRYGLMERSKGTALHFRRHYPDDRRLRSWATHLESLP